MVSEAQPPGEPPSGRLGLVLIAEDDPVTRSMLSDILSAAGYGVVATADGGQALAAAGRNSFDLVVLDVMMPVHDGFEVCRRLKGAARDEGRMIPVLLLTALNARDARMQGLSLGADDYITKPFSLDELMLRVHGLTSNKRFFDDLARRYHEAEQAGELQRRLAAFLVHDFKNPLSALDANLQLLQSSTAAKLDARERGFLLDASACSRRLFALVNTVLDVYRMEEGNLPLKRSDLHVEEVLRACALEFEPLARLKGQRLDVSVDPISLCCDADATLLPRVLGNLVTNALRYTPRGRTVRLIAKSAAAPGWIHLAVEDEAKHISPEHRGLIFEKFGRVESQDLPGHGLGLTFCRLAVRAHGGEIWVEDAEEGNRFVFSLPEAKAPASAAP